MNSGNQPYQSLSFHNASCNEASFVSSSFTCSPSSLSSLLSSFLATPEPECDDQKARSNIVEHLVSEPPPNPKKQHQCPQCLKSFARPSALETHSYTHLAEKPFRCQSPNCGRSFSVASNLRRHFKVHQKAAVGDKLSAENRRRSVRNLMERSNRNPANKNQVLPYSTYTCHLYPAHHEHRKTFYPILPLPPQQPPPSHHYYPSLPDLNINTAEFTMQGPHQAMLLSSAYSASSNTSDAMVPIYWVNQFDGSMPCTPSRDSGASSCR